MKINKFDKTAKTMCVGCQKGFWVIFATNWHHWWYLLGVKLVSLTLIFLLLRYLLGVILEISDEHPRPFLPGVPPGIITASACSACILKTRNIKNIYYFDRMQTINLGIIVPVILTMENNKTCVKCTTVTPPLSRDMYRNSQRRVSKRPELCIEKDPVSKRLSATLRIPKSAPWSECILIIQLN